VSEVTPNNRLQRSGGCLVPIYQLKLRVGHVAAGRGPNKVLVTDSQPQVAGSRRLLRAGQRQR
jgi:hypothetical protein